MSKTYRTIPNNEEVEKIINEKKIKKNDKKHQQIIIADGKYSHPCHDKYNDIIEGKNSAKTKKIAKKIATKSQRNTNKSLEKEDNED